MQKRTGTEESEEEGEGKELEQMDVQEKYEVNNGNRWPL